jgi:hypothetical protein
MARKRRTSIPSWAGRKQWRLTSAEQLTLSSVRVDGRSPDEWSVSRLRAARTASDDVPYERRREIALAMYVFEVDNNLSIALRSFLPEDIWNLLRGLQQAEHGVGSNRMDALRDGEAEYREHADHFVQAWRDCYRLRERLVALARTNGLRGFDDPAGARFTNSRPLESQHLQSLLSVEHLLLEHAGYRAAMWLTARKRRAEVDRPKHRVGTRREIIGLLDDSDLGYERVASLATSTIWRIPPCPSMTRSQLVGVLKSDLRHGRRRPKSRSAPVEV